MADFRRAYELNVFSFFHLSQLVAPEMEKNGGGVILTITSMAAENKNINMTSYASSKAAASHLVRNMAFDLGEKNIRVNGIAPGAILTDALKSVITPEIEQKCYSTRRSDVWANRKILLTQLCSFARLQPAG